MKILLSALAIVAVMTSCQADKSNSPKVNAVSVDDNEVTNAGVQILTIDSCEYVWCKNGYGAGLSHKGNCKYCSQIHR